jgi:hypothetical protein
MSRLAIDAANPRNIPKSGVQYELVGGYLTGTPGALWNGQWGNFPGKTLYTFDQGGAGAPKYNANAMDVEPDCYSPSQVPGWIDKCTAPVPTVYCDRSDYPAVRKVYSGPILLAAPGVQTVPDGYTNIIGIQYMAGSGYDLSIIFDPYWPQAAPAPVTPPPPTEEADMITGTLAPGGKAFVPFTAGSFKNIILMHDFTTDTLVVRVAVHSASKGYNQVVMHGVSTSTPETVTFTESDVDGVSLASVAGDPIGFTLA